MIAWKVDDIRQFTSKLFVGDIFDDFLVREATLVTFNTFTIDGHIRLGYYTDRELEENMIEDLSSWTVLKPICFSLIKGKKLPGSFQVELQLQPKNVQKLLDDEKLMLRPDQINGLYLNIRYEEGELHCVSGTSLNFFTMDKTLDQEWEGYLQRFFKKHDIITTPLK